MEAQHGVVPGHRGEDQDAGARHRGEQSGRPEAPAQRTTRSGGRRARLVNADTAVFTHLAEKEDGDVPQLGPYPPQRGVATGIGLLERR